MRIGVGSRLAIVCLLVILSWGPVVFAEEISGYGTVLFHARVATRRKLDGFQARWGFGDWSRASTVINAVDANAPDDFHALVTLSHLAYAAYVDYHYSGYSRAWRNGVLCEANIRFVEMMEKDPTVFLNLAYVPIVLANELAGKGADEPYSYVVREWIHRMWHGRVSDHSYCTPLYNDCPTGDTEGEKNAWIGAAFAVGYAYMNKHGIPMDDPDGFLNNARSFIRTVGNRGGDSRPGNCCNDKYWINSRIHYNHGDNPANPWYNISPTGASMVGAMMIALQPSHWGNAFHIGHAFFNDTAAQVYINTNGPDSPFRTDGYYHFDYTDAHPAYTHVGSGRYIGEWGDAPSQGAAGGVVGARAARYVGSPDWESRLLEIGGALAHRDYLYQWLTAMPNANNGRWAVIALDSFYAACSAYTAQLADLDYFIY